MKDSPSIPFHIVSGFLGSGKTTFLKNILSQLPAGRKTGIIQNEFAPVPVDGVELKSTGSPFSLLEINNGSVFCVCLLGDFITSLHRFLEEYVPDLVILEASGLSDTTSIAEILSHSLLSGKIHLSRVWCVIDAVSFLHAGHMLQRLVHQIRMADRILINKTDLAPENIPEIRERIKALNPFAIVDTTTYCRVDFQPDVVPPARFLPVPEKPLPRPEVASMVIKTTRKISGPGLSRFLDHWAPLAYRIKGYVNVGDRVTVAVQTTPGQTEIRPVSFRQGPTELIAITDRFTLREWNRSFREHAE